MMKKRKLCFLALCLCAGAAVLLGISLGSVRLPLKDIPRILWAKCLRGEMPEDIPAVRVSILWSIRLPRVCCAFLVGAALSASGAVMQSVLRNALASSYTLGVSSGASLMAAVVIVTGVNLLGRWTLPVAGFVGGLMTVAGALALSSRADRGLGAQTVVLIGMVLSLFVNAFLTLMLTFSGEEMNRILFWQMGSFSGRTWADAGIMAALTLVCFPPLLRYSGEMDLMTFGEEQALASGVNVTRARWTLMILSSVLTGAAVSIAGVIGFVDLIAPHVARKLFGARHKIVLPVSALFGGTFMALSDLLARTVLPARELPVGAVTALIGAPFFAYVYLRSRRA